MASVYEIITAKIIERLEAGTIPWERPWNASSGAPRNIRGTYYKGINVFLLGCQAFSSPYWMTYKQAQEQGGRGMSRSLLILGERRLLGKASYATRFS